MSSDGGRLLSLVTSAISLPPQFNAQMTQVDQLTSQVDILFCESKE